MLVGFELTQLRMRSRRLGFMFETELEVLVGDPVAGGGSADVSDGSNFAIAPVLQGEGGSRSDRQGSKGND